MSTVIKCLLTAAAAVTTAVITCWQWVSWKEKKKFLPNNKVYSFGQNLNLETSHLKLRNEKWVVIVNFTCHFDFCLYKLTVRCVYVVLVVSFVLCNCRKRKEKKMNVRFWDGNNRNKRSVRVKYFCMEEKMMKKKRILWTDWS